MGIDPASGVVIDKHHPLAGTDVTGKMLVLPGGRGSCSGSCGLVELIMSGHAPAALVFETADPILTLGAQLAEEIFGKSIPIVEVGSLWFEKLAETRTASIVHGTLVVDDNDVLELSQAKPRLHLTRHDLAMLDGAEGAGRQAAMRIVRRFAETVGASELIDVRQAHIDCCFYTGPAGLAFAERMVAMGAAVKVPTTTNAASVDRRRWRAMGITAAHGENAERVAAAYVAMGAKASFTCAPYLLAGAPLQGEQIAWGESNAVAYANSVLGARTMKYPDFLDVCVAITGRAPRTASHLDEGRKATLLIDVGDFNDFDDAFYPLLGYHVGTLAGYEIPVITGLADAKPTLDDLKAFSAAFATTSGSPMFHIAGVTPEAPALADVTGLRRIGISREELRRSWHELNSAGDGRVGLVSLGNPHFSLPEIRRTAEICRGRRKAAGIALMITCGRDIHAQAEAEGLIAALEDFGAEFVNDTCWCMVDAQQVAAFEGALMTNSAKFAHYGPGITNRQFHFTSLAACIEAACSGVHRASVPHWLKD